MLLPVPIDLAMLLHAALVALWQACMDYLMKDALRLFALINDAMIHILGALRL